MNANHFTTTRIWSVLVGVSLLITAATAAAQTAASGAKAKTFATAQEAANALIDAAEKFDEAALTEILGPESYDIIHTGEPARDREVAQKFAEQARIKTNVQLQPRNPRRAILEIGEDDWPVRREQGIELVIGEAVRVFGVWL